MTPETPSYQVVLIGLAGLIVLGALTMWLAAKLSKVRASVSRAFMASLFNVLAIVVVFATFGQVAGGFLFFLLTLVLNLLIVRQIFKTDWIDGFKIWLGFMTAIMVFIVVTKALA